MRIAYCISGLMRTYKETYESQLRNIIEPNNCDIFISTWDVAGHARHDKFASDVFQQKINEQEIRKVYGDRLKALSVHDFNEIRPTLPNYFYGGMVAMYWQIHQCDQLRRKYEDENKFSYDYIIRGRSDLMFETGFELKKLNALGPYVWVPNFDDVLMDDCFAFGINDVMSIYSSVYEQLETYNQARDFYVTHPKYNCVCWPEQTLMLHLQRNGLPLKSLPIKYKVCRGEYKYE